MTSLRFDYRNADGTESTRRITGWAEQGHYLVGFDDLAKQVRTFRKDRIARYHDGCEGLLEHPKEDPPPRIVRSAPTDLRPQILFTGFAAALRADLEKQCELAGLRVMKTVSLSLTFLCAGPNAGPAKVAKARIQGVYVLGADSLPAFLTSCRRPESMSVVPSLMLTRCAPCRPWKRIPDGPAASDWSPLLRHSLCERPMDRYINYYFLRTVKNLK